MGRISRITIPTGQQQAVDLTSAGKALIRAFNGDIKVGYDPTQLPYEYFTIQKGEVFVFDQPTALGGELLYLEAVSDAIVEIWLTSYGGIV